MNKKWAVKRITINLASAESEKLERYCAITDQIARFYLYLGSIPNKLKLLQGKNRV